MRHADTMAWRHGVISGLALILLPFVPSCHCAFVPFSHDVGAIGAEVAGEQARHALLVPFVQLARGDGDDAGAEALRAVGKSFARGPFVGEREREMKMPAARIALPAIDLDAPGETADFRHADFNARRAIDVATGVQPGWRLIERGQQWQVWSLYGRHNQEYGADSMKFKDGFARAFLQDAAIALLGGAS